MPAWPELGTRVSVRYRRPAGSVPPFSDAVGHLLAVEPTMRVQTKTGAIVEFAPADVVALRTLTDRPVRTVEIRNLERVAAAARPADEQEWLDGWLLRAGRTDPALSTNSAVPLDVSANAGAIPAIADWYRQRGRRPRLAVPDRLLPTPRGQVSEHIEQVLVCELTERDAVLPYGIDPGGSDPDACVVGDAPDGTRWAGFATPPSSPELLSWAASRGATRGYVTVGEDRPAAIESARALGFRLHHHRRYLALPDSSS
ncbi:GNAT family N-acetyltransferase [Mycobacterium intermedium]|uniref:GNAT family N-acetyltransferase n=1 Tax=Mycobacterium intermedium TaxID=28445 RepID=A0A1E3S6G9_MYCIE|nr:GNAT family N-acetyltransferase [Mycobacterium intermedium]MCV6962660.1 GNAT family N-acetyltransferase [Mycobacterium intermedium]ODQ97684.1 GNAT family N-acetyltransferase [Mycobacterium intermedium]OPE47885.1 GNAT family N-acetyltransferase [Mycobacterium intermedium]ORA96669.1 GNAT family N-acetyltransferase [Mycobacterium intermedium]